MKFLIIPENNSLSHITKCLSLKTVLHAKGHNVYIAVSKERSDFLNKMGFEHHILPDIQENDGSCFPTFKWFSNTQSIIDCINTAILGDRYSI